MVAIPAELASDCHIERRRESHHEGFGHVEVGGELVGLERAGVELGGTGRCPGSRWRCCGRRSETGCGRSRRSGPSATPPVRPGARPRRRSRRSWCRSWGGSRWDRWPARSDRRAPGGRIRPTPRSGGCRRRRSRPPPHRLTGLARLRKRPASSRIGVTLPVIDQAVECRIAVSGIAGEVLGSLGPARSGW